MYGFPQPLHFLYQWHIIPVSCNQHGSIVIVPIGVAKKVRGERYVYSLGPVALLRLLKDLRLKRQVPKRFSDQPDLILVAGSAGVVVGPHAQ